MDVGYYLYPHKARYLLCSIVLQEHEIPEQLHCNAGALFLSLFNDFSVFGLFSLSTTNGDAALVSTTSHRLNCNSSWSRDAKDTSTVTTYLGVVVLGHFAGG